MMNKRGIVVMVLVLGLGFNSLAAAESATFVTGSSSTPFTSNIGGISVGMIKVGSAEIGSVAWRPDFKLGPWGLGADINIPIGSGASGISGYENLVLRYVEYDDNQKGLRYGVLENITWGHGLLVKNYTTRPPSSVILSNENAGLKGYVDLDYSKIIAMGTKTNIYGGRIEERVHPFLNLGQHYISDSDGTLGFPSVSAIGADASVPLPSNFELYAEYDQLINHAGGFETGLTWAYDLMVAKASFQAAYRLFAKGFIPSFFGYDYESNPPNLASAEANGRESNGYIAIFDAQALGLASLNLQYENYVGSNPALTGNAFAKVNEQISVGAYYKQPSFTDFRSISFQQGAVLDTFVAYKVNPNSTVVAHVKQAYNPSTARVEESQYYEFQFNL